MDLNLDLKKFNKDGYLLVRNVFSKEEIKFLEINIKQWLHLQKRNLIDSTKGFSKHKLLIGDLCSFDELEEFATWCSIIELYLS